MGGFARLWVNLNCLGRCVALIELMGEVGLLPVEQDVQLWLAMVRQFG